MAKKLKFGDEARRKIQSGVDQVANAVKSTLGPRGQNVIFESRPENIVTNDGVTIAKQIELKDRFENLGAQLVKEAAQKTNDEAGDGTTTATLLTQVMVEEGTKQIATGRNPMIMKDGMKRAKDLVLDYLKKLAKPITTHEEKKQVATISANGDEEIGNLIAEVFGEVGDRGVVTISDNNSPTLEKEVVKGIKWDKGIANLNLITNREKLRAEMEDVHIVMTTDEITTQKQLIPVVEKLVTSKEQGGVGIGKFVLIARSIGELGLAFIIANRVHEKFHCVAVKAPSYGDYQIDLLEDIATITGGKVLGDDVGKKLEQIEESDLGKAKNVVVSTKDTIITGGYGNQEEVNKRVESIKVLMEEFKDDIFKIEKLKERHANLVGGIGVIKVGAFSEMEQKEIKYRVEDSLNATKAAIEEGIVPGGGVALLRATESLTEPFNNEEEEVGRQIVKKALRSPLLQIAKNSGVDSPDNIVEKVLESKDTSYGYDARKGEYVNMIENGIIDPVKVVRNAIENAVHTAAIILTTNTAIVNIDEKK